MEYQIYNNTILVDSEMPHLLAGGGGLGDYAELFERYNICELVQQGKVDEIWIWAGNGNGTTKPHMLEWQTSGPTWSWYSPNCGRDVTTMTFNYTREVDVALESYSHRMEGFFSHYNPCDFSTATWPWAGSTAFPSCGPLLSNQYGFVARPYSGNGNIGACGDAHHPPNILGDTSYDYTNLGQATSMCEDWSEDGSAQTKTYNCQEWGCSHWGFHVWWMQNIPGYNNANRNRTGGSIPNWWDYLVSPSGETYSVFLPLIQKNSLVGAGSMYSASAPNTAQPAYPMPSIATIPGSNAGAPLMKSPPTGEPWVATSTQPAVKKPVAFVVYFPGYGDSPRTTIQEQTQELIALLREGTVYHGYQYNPPLQPTFIGQDGQSYAGAGCFAGTVANNAHIHLNNIRTDSAVTNYTVEDYAGGGKWESACAAHGTWLLYAASPGSGQVDLYFRPFRDVPAGTGYLITVQYADGATQTTLVEGSRIYP